MPEHAEDEAVWQLCFSLAEPYPPRGRDSVTRGSSGAGLAITGDGSSGAPMGSWLGPT